MTVETHLVERRNGDGARVEADDLYENESYEQDERGPNQTTYWESDVERAVTSRRRQRQLKRALELQEGQHTTHGESRGSQNNAEDTRRVAETFSSKLDMTPYQRRRVAHLVTDVLDINSFGPYSREKVILSVVNVVAREDMAYGGELMEDRDDFKALLEDVDADLDELRRLRGLVSDRL